MLRLPREVPLQHHQMLPRKVRLQRHQILRLPRKMTLMIDPTTTMRCAMCDGRCEWCDWCHLTELLLNCDLREQRQDRTVTLLNCYIRDWAIAWLNCYLSELLLQCFFVIFKPPQLGSFSPKLPLIRYNDIVDAANASDFMCLLQVIQHNKHPRLCDPCSSFVACLFDQLSYAPCLISAYLYMHVLYRQSSRFPRYSSNLQKPRRVTTLQLQTQLKLWSQNLPPAELWGLGGLVHNKWKMMDNLMNLAV